MIAYLIGTLTSVQDDSILVEVGGVGYEVNCPNPFAFQSSLNKEIKVYTYHHVREDLQLLYGFKDEDEKYLFTKLISVSGIGPKDALGIMSHIDIAEFVSAIEREDDTYLKSFPGVGKKTSRQIILDLKGKLTGLFSLTSNEATHEVPASASLEHLNEAAEALKALGYTSKEINHIMPTLHQENLHNTDELIKKALSLLVKN